MVLVPHEYRLKNTIKYPTTIIVGGLCNLGLEVAKALIEQGGYVVIVDTVTQESVDKLQLFPKESLISFLDYSAIPHLEEDIRRLDYVIHFGHESVDFRSPVSTQEFLTFSNYLDAVLSLAAKFEAKFLLTTSIKANQLLLTELDLGAGIIRASAEKQSTYTDMELQKYAEGLVLEYEKKVNLDSRVVRLGEIIGEGMDFDTSSEFVRLIISAARGDYLELVRDGLENEWYVHIQDAAYAMIKALFTKGTKGKVYSVSYDSPITHLALAYKIQEVNENPKEIRFVDDKDNLPSIRLYKPAPNLSDIGWMPRVTFNKAVKQSLASCQVFLAENTVKSLSHSKSAARADRQGKQNFSHKLKNFLSIAKKKEQQDIFKTEADVVADMVTENREKEKQRRHRLLIASTELKKRKKVRSKSPLEKINDAIWRTFIYLGNTFTFLQRRSPLEVGFFLVLITIFLFAYFAVIAPTIYLARNIVTLRHEYNSLSENLETKNYKDLQKNSQNINKSISEINKTLDRYEIIAKPLTLDNEFRLLKSTVESYKIMADGMIDVTSGVTPIFEYTSAYKNNLELRSGSDSYLAVSENGLSYSNELKKLELNSPLIDSGLEKIKLGYEKINTIDYSPLPAIISEEIIATNQKLIDQIKKIEFLENEKYLGELLGADEEQTHLILLLDNTRLTQQGGELAGFAFITVKEGSITQIIVQSTDLVQVPSTLTDQSTLQEINNTQFISSTAGNLTLNDFTNIDSYERFAQTMREAFTSKYQKPINGVVTIDLNALEDYLNYLSSKGKVAQIGQTNFGVNILNDLAKTQTTNENIEVKKRNESQLLAFALKGIFDDLGVNYSETLSLFSKQYQNQSLRADFNSGKFSTFIKQNDVDTAQIENSNTYMKVSANIDDVRLVNIQQFSDFTIDLKASITSVGAIENVADISFNTPGAIKEITTCVPLSVSLTSIKLVNTNIAQSSMSINSSDFERCIVVKVTDQTNVTLSWRDDNFVNIREKLKFKYGIGKVNGALTKLNFSLELKSGQSIKGVNPDSQFSSTSLSFFKNIFRDLTVETEIE